MYRLIRTCLTAATALSIGLLLAACTITSEKQLLTTAEAAAPLPDRFVFYPYEPGPDGYVRSNDAPVTFVHEGSDYLARDIPDAKGPMDIRFVALGDNAFLLAAIIAGDEGVVYGFARYANSVLSIALSPGKASTAALARERRGAMPKAGKALDAISVNQATDEIAVSSRAALDYLSGMYLAGRLPMEEPSVAFIAEDPKAPTPSRLVASESGWVRVP